VLEENEKIKKQLAEKEGELSTASKLVREENEKLKKKANRRKGESTH